MPLLGSVVTLSNAPSLSALLAVSVLACILAARTRNTVHQPHLAGVPTKSCKKPRPLRLSSEAVLRNRHPSMSLPHTRLLVVMMHEMPSPRIFHQASQIRRSSALSHPRDTGVIPPTASASRHNQASHGLFQLFTSLTHCFSPPGNSVSPLRPGPLSVPSLFSWCNTTPPGSVHRIIGSSRTFRPIPLCTLTPTCLWWLLLPCHLDAY